MSSISINSLVDTCDNVVCAWLFLFVRTVRTCKFVTKRLSVRMLTACVFVSVCQPLLVSNGNRSYARMYDPFRTVEISIVVLEIALPIIGQVLCDCPFHDNICSDSLGPLSQSKCF